MTADARGAHLPELLATLWPDAAGPGAAGADAAGPGAAGPGAATAGAVRTYRIVPSRARPRLLAPATAPRAAAAVVRYAAEAVGGRARARRALLAGALRLGAGRLLFRDTVRVPTGDSGGIDGYLAAAVGHPVLLGVHIGPPRANRKPVLTLLQPDGTLAGFAKLSVNPLTGALVDAEASALRRLAGAEVGPVVVPRVLHHGSWRGHAVLVQSALPVWLPRAAGAAAAVAEESALVRLARCFGTRTGPAAASAYADRLADGLARLAPDPDAARLAGALDRLTAGPGAVEFGCWHGDYNGGNAAVLADGRVLVWDWERFDADVPVGFDALHRALQTAITRQRVPAALAAQRLLAGAPRLLAPFGAAPAAPVVAGLYLVELGARYLRDRQREAGARLGRLGDWLLPALDRHVEEAEWQR